MRAMSAAVDRIARIETLIRENPEAAVVVGVAVLAAVAAGLVVLRVRRTPGVRFRRLLSEEDAIAVLMHPNPDPDAMSAAIGVASLADQIGVDATVQYPGQIRHQENRAFQTVLNLELETIEHVSDLAAESVVLVDHNEPRGFAGADGVLPTAVIDHHPGDGSGEAFTDVRTDYGATASIIAEYFRDNDATPVPPDKHASETGSDLTLRPTPRLGCCTASSPTQNTSPWAQASRTLRPPRTCTPASIRTGSTVSRIPRSTPRFWR